MSSTEAQIDATFYQMVHQFVHASEDKQDDRRRHKRQRFFGVQWIAPWDGSRLPSESEFIEVQCHDLTPGGFSFFFARRPTFPLVAAGFGRKPNLLYIGAEIVRSVPVLLFPSGRIKQVRDGETQIQRYSPSGEAGRPTTLIGCRFLRRLS